MSITLNPAPGAARPSQTGDVRSQTARQAQAPAGKARWPAGRDLIVKLTGLPANQDVTWSDVAGGPSKSGKADANGNLTLNGKAGANLLVKSTGTNFLEVSIKNAGTNTEALTLKVNGVSAPVTASATDKGGPDARRWSGVSKGGPTLSLHMPAALSNLARVVLDDVYGHAEFTIGKTRYAVIDAQSTFVNVKNKDGSITVRNAATIRAALQKKGVVILDDIDTRAGSVAFTTRVGADLVDGVVKPSGQPASVGFDFTLSDIGLQKASGWVGQVTGQSNPNETNKGPTQWRTVSDPVSKVTKLKTLSETPATLVKNIEQDIAIAQARVDDVLQGMRLLQKTGDFKKLSTNIDQVMTTVGGGLPAMIEALDRATKSLVKDGEYIINAEYKKGLDEKLKTLRASVDSFPKVFSDMLDGIAAGVINGGAEASRAVARERKQKLISLFNAFAGTAFLALGTLNGFTAFLPVVLGPASRAKSFGKAVAIGAVTTTGTPIPTQLEGFKNDVANYKRIYKDKVGGAVDPVSDPPNFLMDPKVYNNSPIVAFARNALIKFQIDIATRGPWQDKTTPIPAERNPLWNDGTFVKRLAAIREKRDPKNPYNWQAKGGTHKEAAEIAEKYPYLFEDIDDIKGRSQGMSTLRVVHNPDAKKGEPIGYFTREVQKKEDDFTSSRKTQQLELFAINPWLGIY